MPILRAKIVERLSPETAAQLETALAAALRAVFPDRDEVLSLETTGPEADARALVAGYLAAMEARDLPSAEAVLADAFVMTFPGTGPMHSLRALLDWAAPRYRFVTKSITAMETLQDGPVTVVYVRGTLAGAWPSGAAFEGIRFIDRFEVAAGRITRQEVWNDLAETRPE